MKLTLSKLLILTLVVTIPSMLLAQVTKPKTTHYLSTEQKLIKGLLGDMTEQITHNQVFVNVVLNKYDFIYPNHEHKDVLVTMTQDEFITGLSKDFDFKIEGNPDVKDIYFMKDKMEIWVDFTNGETIFYFVKPVSVSKKK